ncbi:MAG TPA: response regulator [Gemmataceae bacterium]|nr:response regulator [Gemmataceae bacterium]
MSATVLVIDDDADVRDSLQAAFERAGYRVVTAADGDAGLAAAERESPGLVVVDMMMPRKSGFLVLEKLKARAAAPPVIMITANEGGQHQAYAARLGVDDYLRKPFDLDRLLASARRLCPPEE